MRVVVAGAGLAGLRSAEALRKAGFSGEITVVGAEPHMPYNRPPLSKDAVGAAFDPGQLPFRVAKAAADVTWRLGEAAVAADLTARTVTLGGGAVLDWDGLVVATGVRSRRLSLPGPDAGRHAIRTLDDLAVLRKDLEPARRVVVVGGGFIGCEAAAAARARGLEVTVVEPEPLPMRRPLGDELAAALLRRHQARGVRFVLGTAPVAFEGNGRVRAVTLTDGTTLDADLVVESVGSIPNTEWLAGSGPDGGGLDLADGVACDDRLRVLPAGGAGRGDVVAAGDVARFPHPLLSGQSRRMEHWTVATDSGKHAGAALARHLSGGDPAAGQADGPSDGTADGPAFTAVPSFWSDQYETRIQSFGVTGADESSVLEGDLDGDVAVGYHRHGRLIGVVLIGLGSRFTHYRAQIADTITTLA
jgi:3-phenylpropionate/trans-cinnamate dioxygenase ferredoxin reductase component